MSSGPGPTQRWVIEFMERWEGTPARWVPRREIIGAWVLHANAAHPIPGAAYGPEDRFGDRSATFEPERVRRSRANSVSRGIRRLVGTHYLQLSTDDDCVRLVLDRYSEDAHYARIAHELEYARSAPDGRPRSPESELAVAANIGMVILESWLSPALRQQWDTECIDRDNDYGERRSALIDLVATQEKVTSRKVADLAVRCAAHIVRSVVVVLRSLAEWIRFFASQDGKVARR